MSDEITVREFVDALVLIMRQRTGQMSHDLANFLEQAVSYAEAKKASAEKRRLLTKHSERGNGR